MPHAVGEHLFIEQSCSVMVRTWIAAPALMVVDDDAQDRLALVECG
jgi:hypothetical protein